MLTLALRCGALAVAVTLLLAVPVRAQSPWQARTFQSSGGLTLPYRLLGPEKVEPGKRYPLVLCLHGAGERGSDNAAQLKNGVKGFFEQNRERFPAFVIAPQCPDKQAWVECDWTAASHVMAAKPSAALQAAMELLERTEKELPVDRTRVYVMGISMGGFGTWELLARQPERFAAGVPICGGADLATAPRVAAVPVWAFHGGQDNVVKVSRSRGMVEALRARGAQVRYTEYPGVGHDSWWKTLAEPDLAAWLFAQRRK